MALGGSLLGLPQVGDRAELTIVRSGQTLSVRVEVGDKPEDLQTSGGQNETQTAQKRRGCQLQPLVLPQPSQT